MAKVKVDVSKLRMLDPTGYLRDEKDCAAYLNTWLGDGTPEEIARALGDIARARGMSQLAIETGLSRESLYKGLSGERAPSTDTLLRVVRALGVKLVAVPV
jgi:probable addiction module antidote protein